MQVVHRARMQVGIHHIKFSVKRIFHLSHGHFVSSIVISIKLLRHSEVVCKVGSRDFWTCFGYFFRLLSLSNSPFKELPSCSVVYKTLEDWRFGFVGFVHETEPFDSCIIMPFDASMYSGKSADNVVCFQAPVFATLGRVDSSLTSGFSSLAVNFLHSRVANSVSFVLFSLVFARIVDLAEIGLVWNRSILNRRVFHHACC